MKKKERIILTAGFILLALIMVVMYFFLFGQNDSETPNISSAPIQHGESFDENFVWNTEITLSDPDEDFIKSEHEFSPGEFPEESTLEYNPDLKIEAVFQDLPEEVRWLFEGNLQENFLVMTKIALSRRGYTGSVSIRLTDEWELDSPNGIYYFTVMVNESEKMPLALIMPGGPAWKYDYEM